MLSVRCAPSVEWKTADSKKETHPGRSVQRGSVAVAVAVAGTCGCVRVLSGQRVAEKREKGEEAEREM